MIAGLTWLLAFQVLGEVLVRVLDVTVPGPVAGMLLLFVFLRLRRYGDDGSIVTGNRSRIIRPIGSFCRKSIPKSPLSTPPSHRAYCVASDSSR